MNPTLTFNARVSHDLQEILAYYESKNGTSLADKFFGQLMDRISQIRDNPKQFPFFGHGVRRANLQDFPHHLLYRVKAGGVHIFVLRHDSRNPNYGMRRR